MRAIEGTIRNGQIVPDERLDLPDGSRVRIEPVKEEETLGMREEDWPTDPKAIADWLQWYDSLGPLEMTPEEEADLAAWRKQIKEYSIEKGIQRIEGLFP